MAILNLNGVTLDEIQRNSRNAYAASISSGEIFSVEGCHSKNGNPMLRIAGKYIICKSFDGSTFIADGCILYNPALTRAIVEACDNTAESIYIVGGTVTKTAPAAETSDTVVSKEALLAEKNELQSKFFSLKDTEQETAKSRIAAIEALLKTA